MENYQLSNIVGNGNLKIDRLDLDTIEKDLKKDYYVEREYPTKAIKLHLPNTNYITIHKSGSYIIRANNKDKLFKDNETFKKFSKNSLKIEPENNFKICNITANYNFNKKLRLDKINQNIKYKSSYEPEQFSCVNIYLDNSTILLYNSGKLVSVGSSTIQESKKDIKKLKKELKL